MSAISIYQYFAGLRECSYKEQNTRRVWGDLSVRQKGREGEASRAGQKLFSSFIKCHLQSLSVLAIHITILIKTFINIGQDNIS